MSFQEKADWVALGTGILLVILALLGSRRKKR